ncbi:MAG TPA: hypothetical protein DEB10_13600 [Ruminococcaceae bacterium]|nr:hypothetical protein [Oscillospiraceae bacterium]
MKKRLLIVSASVLIIAVWAARLIYLNTHTPFANELYYSMGETVAYEDDFFNASDENRDGYSIIVKRATIYPYQEFADKMNIVLSPKSETAYFRADYVYDVEVTIINKGNEVGAIDMFNTLLVNSNLRMPIDIAFWELMYPQLGGSYSFKLRPDTQMDFHFPYTIETSFEQKNISLQDLKTRPLLLNISNYPDKKMIRIELS